MRVLLLGGTAEASRMARALADAGIPALFSYAGRTGHPADQPLPTRVGGFGGVGGLVAYLREGGFSHVIDATHPFAAGMTSNAVAACAVTGTPLVALERRPWTPAPGDRWTTVADSDAAARALPELPARIFLAIGRQNIGAFAARPQHHYLLRLVDPPAAALPLTQTSTIIARGPFDLDGDVGLMRGCGIDILVAKNAGGEGARAKIDAARLLGLPVVMIDRPSVPDRTCVETVSEAMDWLHQADLGV